MSLKHAILVMLENEPGTGYDLAQRFKSGIGHFWNAKHQQIYLELKKLHRDKWVAFEVEAQSEKPDKKIYRITRTGQKALKEWLRKPVKPPRINDALLVKVFGGQQSDAPVLVAELDEHITRYRARLEEYGQMEQVFFEQDGATRSRYRLPYLTLRRGIRYVRGTLEWLEEARTLLAEGGVPAKPLLPVGSRKTAAKR
jgi:PadR family transcriptional regulator, regulatory protein AphA